MSALSAASDVTAEGFTLLTFLDEVYMIYKAVTGLSAVVCYLFSSSSGDTGFVYPEIMKQESLFAAPDRSETTTTRALLTNNVCPFFIDVTCRFKSMEIVLHNSRTSDGLESFATIFHSLTGNKMAVHKLPEHGIWMLVQNTTVVISCEEGKMDLLTDLSGILSFVFEYQSSIGTNIDHIVPESLLLQSINCLHEVSLSGFSFTLSLGLVQNALSSGNAGKTFGSSNGNSSYFVRETNLTAFERSSNLSPQSILKMGSPSNTCVPASTNHWLLIDVAVTSIFIGRCSLKSELIQAHKLNKLLSLLSIGGEFHIISWEIQGGFFLLETTSLPMAIDSYSSYLCYIGNLTSDAKLPKTGTKWEQNVRENYTSHDVIDRGAISTSQQAASRLPEACDFSLSHFTFVLAHENESGCIQEIVVEVDIHMNFALAITGMKLTIDLSRLSILSQTIQRRVEDEAAIPHFSSVTSKDLTPLHASGNPLSGFQNFGQLNSISDASCSKNTLPIQVISHQNQILKNLRAFLSLERPDNGVMLFSRCWFGIGSLLGFDITLSIAEIQTIMSMSSSLSEISSQNTIKKLEKNDWSSSHEVDNCLEAMIPDGAIVAIQDVNQHMYFTVEGEEKTFRVGGVIHYSLVGERALFRVRIMFKISFYFLLIHFSIFCSIS
ncbi:uncharacterized protein LOC124821402 [Vigna umbellata]|uniref:uncharacterized protein LOC124821402 n=1 Tax=Vigna umbellata TaxID=87088 RepID=UPI001F5E839D|nr:uncharacterized protein LOC124821402 [Vigna umbellata]